MQKRTLFALARGLLALLGLCLGGFVAPTLAGVYQASTNVSLFTEFVPNVGFSLPKYSGPGKITGITLTLSGSAQGTEFFDFFTQDGITVAPFGETWDFLVGGPVFSGGEELGAPTTLVIRAFRSLLAADALARGRLTPLLSRRRSWEAST
jgi:hypothetical protein